MKYSVLVVDDNPAHLSSTRALLTGHGYHVEVQSDPEMAIALVRQKPSRFAVAILDWEFPCGMTGTKLAKALREVSPDQLIIFYTGHENEKTLKETYRYAMDFVCKDEPTESLLRAISRACRKFDETTRVLEKEDFSNENVEVILSVGLAGISDGLAQAIIRAQKYQSVNKPVLIEGETGVGKELFAKLIHGGPSNRFFPVNCASFSSDNQLMESELFGHVRGAFTGAANQKIGILEEAGAGTVFLDELHHLSKSAQAKLLRAIQEKRIRRVGATDEIDIKCRIVAAVNRDFDELVKDEVLLSDFSFRGFHSFRVVIPPLRERKEDIPALVYHFSEKMRAETGKVKRFLVATVRLMQSYSWPGNVRELENEIERIFLEIEDEKIEPKHLSSRFFEDTDEDTTERNYLAMTWAELQTYKKQIEFNYLKHYLDRFPGNKSLAARAMCTLPSTLHSKMIAHGLYEKTNDLTMEAK